MNTSASHSTVSLQNLLSDRILIIDGSMGALLFQKGLTEEDYRGRRFRDHGVLLKNATDVLCLTQPETIAGIHREYLAAGADIVETNTFGANVVTLREFGLADLTQEINRAAAELARREADACTRKDPGKPRFVAGSIGPTNVQLSLNADQPGTRPIQFDDQVASYAEQVRGLLDGGVDLLLPETSFDTLNMKACLFAIGNVFAERGCEVPVIVSGTIFDGGRTLTAQTVEAFYTSLQHFPMLAIGLNCSLGPRQMRPYIEALATTASLPVICYPNAGLPDGMGGFDSNPEEFTAQVRDFAVQGWVNIVGGCCGTTPEYIHKVADAVAGIAPRRPPAPQHIANFSGLERYELRPESNFYMVGERTNVTGSRKFARLIKEENYDEALECGPRAGRERGQHARRQHGRRAARLDRLHAEVPVADLRRRGHPRPHHDRQFQLERHRGRAQMRTGQGGRQLHLAEGGGGEVPGTGAAGAAVWSGRRRYGVR